MNADAQDWDDEIDDDEATLAAAGDALAEIRAEAKRVKGDGDPADRFDPSEDPTTIMIDLDPDAANEPAALDNLDPDLANEPTSGVNFDPANDVTVIDVFDVDDHTTGAFDAGDDPTTLVGPDDVEAASAAPAARPGPRPKSRQAAKPNKAKPATVAAGPDGSLIDGKAPPVASASYWERGDMASSVAASAKAGKSGKGPIPTWFLATSMLAVLLAVGLVLLVMWALSGSPA